MAECDSTEGRTCTACGQTKPATLDFFHSHKRGSAGLNPRCKECRKQESRAYYLANGEQVRESARVWQAENPEKANAKKLAWARKHAESENARKREYKSRPEVRSRTAARMREREQTDMTFRLRRLMSRRMWMSLRHAKDGWSWESLVGYTRTELHAHLERQFTRGMNWERFAKGDIHIDHIIPVASFQYQSPSDPDFLACWALANLRPMWASENCSKGAQVLTLL